MKIIHFTRLASDAKALTQQLLNCNKSAVCMDWADAEIVAAFNAGEYTDLVTTYIAGATGFRAEAEVLIHHALPIGQRDDPFVVEANNRSPEAVVIYKYADHFEYGRLSQ